MLETPELLEDVGELVVRDARFVPHLNPDVAFEPAAAQENLAFRCGGWRWTEILYPPQQLGSERTQTVLGTMQLRP